MAYAGLNLVFGCLQRGQRQSAGRSSKAGFNCPVIITPQDFLDRKEEF